MMEILKEALYLRNNEILLVYKGGQKRIFDVSPFLNAKVFLKLRNSDELKKVKVKNGALEWECGACLCGDTAYIRSTPLIEEKECAVSLEG